MTATRHAPSLDLPLLCAGMLAVLVAQFLSALADNAILIAAIAVAKLAGQTRLVPLLQGSFVLPFVVLAPFVGAIADGFPKGRVMLAANGLKLAGAVAMAAGADPLLSYALVGVGAAGYSPAKYGILAQMFGPQRLVRANGMIEGSTIAAILLGVLVGGWLADHSLAWAFGGVIACYAGAAAANLAIPRLPPETGAGAFEPLVLLRRFAAALRALLANADARFSVIGTSIFWGSGSTLRLMLFAWVPVALHVEDNQTPANLMGVLSIGIVGGAAAAGAWISLAKVDRALLGGVLLGPLVGAMSQATGMQAAAALMAAIGFCGGLFVVPLNALLQERGHETVGAGSALAVQNFSENLAMLLFVGAYSLVQSAGLGVRPTVAGFGLVLIVAIGTIAALRLRRAAATLSPGPRP